MTTNPGQPTSVINASAIPTEPRFVITGTGRHGSGYIGRLLWESGIRCGHEQWFNPWQGHTEGLDGDSSWCAVPFLHTYDGIVFHQVRDPLAVIASLVAAPDAPLYRALRLTLVPDDPDPVTFAMRCYVAFNETIEPYAVARWCVEDVDADLVGYIGAKVGVLVRTVADVPHDVNAHNSVLTLKWGDLPGGPLLERLARMANRYGYL